MDDEVKIGSKVSVEMDGVEDLVCEITAKKDGQVQVSFWINEGDVESA